MEKTTAPGGGPGRGAVSENSFPRWRAGGARCPRPAAMEDDQKLLRTLKSTEKSVKAASPCCGVPVAACCCMSGTLVSRLR